MKYLLDTHAVLWVTESHPNLSSKVRNMVRALERDTFQIAAITLLEISRLAKSGVITFSVDPARWLEQLNHRFTILPLTPAIAWRSVNLDWEHRDPADRLICSTAIQHHLTLISKDREIHAWGGVPVLW